MNAAQKSENNLKMVGNQIEQGLHDAGEGEPKIQSGIKNTDGNLSTELNSVVKPNASSKLDSSISSGRETKGIRSPSFSIKRLNTHSRIFGEEVVTRTRKQTDPPASGNKSSIGSHTTFKSLGEILNDDNTMVGNEKK